MRRDNFGHFDCNYLILMRTAQGHALGGGDVPARRPRRRRQGRQERICACGRSLSGELQDAPSHPRPVGGPSRSRQIATPVAGRRRCGSRDGGSRHSARGYWRARGMGLGTDAGGGPLWRELGLEATLDKLAAPARREAPRLSDRTRVLVVNRLTAPGSEHGLARWLETDFVCDRCGRRWLAAWRDDGERLASRTPRVRVELRQLKTWYRTLDQLLEHKDTIKHALFITLRDLFSLQVDMVFYDLTSTYFEGHGPAGIGANGHS